MSGEQNAEPKNDDEDEWVNENEEDSLPSDDNNDQLNYLEGCEFERVRKNYDW